MDYLLDLLSAEVPQYAHNCGSYFGLLRGYVETCPRASVHLSNRSGTRRLLSFLVADDVEKDKKLAIDTGAPPMSSQSPRIHSTSKEVPIETDTGPLSIIVPSIVSPQKEVGFPTWVSGIVAFQF